MESKNKRNMTTKTINADLYRDSAIDLAAKEMMHTYSRLLKRIGFLSLPPVSYGDDALKDAPELRLLIDNLPRLQLETREFMAATTMSNAVDSVDTSRMGCEHAPDWKLCLLHSHGLGVHEVHPVAIQKMPVLVGLLDLIGYVGTATLSVLGPGPNIPPHVDVSSIWRRIHIPLIVPDPSTCGQCVMHVAGKSFPIEEGVPYSFDETYTHGVENNLTEGIRVNLLLNIILPGPSPLLNSFNQYGFHFVYKNLPTSRELTKDLQPREHPLVKVLINPLRRGNWLTAYAKYYWMELLWGTRRTQQIIDVVERNSDIVILKDLSNEEKSHLTRMVVMLHHSIEAGVYVTSMLPSISLNFIATWCTHLAANNIPGGFLEAGVWRGGATIFMRKMSQELSNGKRKVYVLDSFQHMEDISVSNHEEDIACDKQCSKILNISRKELGSKADIIRTSLAEVKENFDFVLGTGATDNVEFLEGWFDHDFPWERVSQLAIIRLDCDYYKPTKTCLKMLYDKLSVGGVVILDEYYLKVMGEGVAVDEFRAARCIKSPIIRINANSAYWIKTE